MQHEKLCTDRFPRIIDRFFHFDCKYISYTAKAGRNRRLFAQSSHSTTSNYQQSPTATPVARFCRNPTQKYNYEDTDPVQGDLMRVLPEWLEEFRDNPVDEGVSALQDTPASTSREPDSEHPSKVVSGKHSARGYSCRIVPWQALQKSTVTLVSGPVVTSHV